MYIFPYLFVTRISIGLIFKLVYAVLPEFVNSLTSSQFQNRILPNPFNNGIEYGTIELIPQSSK